MDFDTWECEWTLTPGSVSGLDTWECEWTLTPGSVSGL